MPEFLLEETNIAPSTRERARGLALQGVLDRIKGDTNLHNRNFKIARYEKRSSASGAQTALKGKYGDGPECDGFTIGVHPDDEKEGSFVLIANYDPSKVVPGRLEESVAKFKAAEKEKQAKYKANAAAKKASGNGTGGTSAPVGVNQTPTTNTADSAPAAQGATPDAAPAAPIPSQATQTPAGRRARSAGNT